MKMKMNSKEHKTGLRQCLFAVVLVSVFFSWLSPAYAWWNEEWRYRKRIVFDTTATMADIKEDVAEVPILLRLHTGNFSFADAKEDGSDIRFVSADDTMLLKHHVEKFDPIDEMALIWVKIPRLPGGSNQGFIRLYYGNGSAVKSDDPPGTYDTNQAVVYHFDACEGLPQDATAYGNHAISFTGSQCVPSVIGNGITLNGAGDMVRIPAPPSLNFSTGFTFSAWVRIPQPVEDAYIFSREEANKALVIGIDQTSPYCRISHGNGQVIVTDKVTELAPGTWYHLSVIAAPHGRLAMYVDGIEIYGTEFPMKLPALSGESAVGGSVRENHFFLGELDELQIANVARPAAWIKAAARGQGPEGVLCSYEQEEFNPGAGLLPVHYFGTVMKNITLDGWMIIATLMILSAASWIIFVNKLLFLRVVEQENETFLTSYSELTDVTGLKDEADDFENASLYRIYRAGCDGLQQWGGNPHPDFQGKITSSKGLNAFKTALEKAYIKESQRINTWMVILTMAITGGPFLGLLGTVWGVMNTFAAMAEAGEANIMAIAPGVASALSTTVVGLLVAIPALFAYNYLSSRIKNMTADMGIFVDEFVVKVDGTDRGVS
jgi:biopolymer transport protein ExbB